MRALDLREFGKRLPAEYRRLRGLIRDTHDRHTAHTDLTLALDFACRAIDLQSKESGLPEKVVEDCTLALLSSAIVFYARATKSESKHRKTFDLRKQFDEGERQVHRTICALRDDAIAHYGPGHLTDSVTLRDDHIFLPADGNQLVFASRNMWGSQQFSHMLRRQTQRALLVSQRLFEEKQTELAEALNLVVDDPAIGHARAGSIVNLADAMGDVQMAEQILVGPRVGTRRLSGSVPGEKG